MNSSIIQEEPTSDPNEIQTYYQSNAFCFSLVLLSTLFLLKVEDTGQKKTVGVEDMGHEVTACVICFTFVFEVLPNQIQLVYNIEKNIFIKILLNGFRSYVYKC
ncbi:unnamed protein product [Brassica rapa]|uniref:Uncharacterized protein n=1 Tax=Brassica campestris TaxID=3711 RepID=A0A8D9DCS7_BRACM|nr:unnamed protein product [Brassica rapa]